MFVLFLLVLTWSQPCTTPQQMLTSTIIGSCSAGTSSDTYVFPLTVTSGSAFTVSGWFQLDTQGTDHQALFSVQQNGVRLGFVVHDQIIDFLYDSHTVSSAFAYSLKKWFMAAATLSYTLGYVNYYVWLPMNDLRIVQAPVSAGVNFNTAITSDAKLYILYFNSYGLYCGRAQNVFFFDGYYEGDQNYNWMNLAFLENTIDTIAHFSLEDQSGQKVLGTTGSGYLGSTRGPDTADPTPGYYVKLLQTQYVTLPAVILNTNSQSVSFWLWTNLLITGDAFVQTVDIGDEVIIFKRSYGNTQDQFQILLSGTSPYTLEVNFGTTKAPIVLTPTVTGSTWTYISIASTFTDSSIGVSKVYFGAYVNGAYHPHTQTTLALSYAESENDILYLGNQLNQFNNEIRIAHLDIRSTYVNYYSATSVNCLTNCLHSVNSFTQQKCKKCITTKLQNDACAASCTAGNTGFLSAILPVCSRCSYQCSACSSGVLCSACSSGYYLSGTACVVAASCGVGFLANPITKQCTKCGDGTVQAGETCDDGNFIDGDGCTSCAVDTGYTCNASTPNVCSKKCGNGVLDTGEQCDIGSSLINGCQNCVLESGYQCGGISCTLLCGNGQRINEDCDDGNTVSGDGCSHCQVDFGYKCSGGTATSADSCTKQCPNNVIDQTEQCDDNNNNSNDGCAYCRIEIGFKCVNNSCYSLCGNGEIDELEMCDDSNTIVGDGCSRCLIDYGYECDESALSCHMVTVTCGDSYHSSSEACEDGNIESGDGCSDVCAVESGYTCSQGLYKYSITPCIPICGDGKKLGNEQCDDGNLIDGDGCSRYCTIETVCGNAIRETGEQCDDGNAIDMDGCTNCIPDPGYNCNLIVGGTVDKCNQCPNNCDECTSDGVQCTLCFHGYALYNYECYTQCPQSYYYDNTTCSQCPTNCLECFSTTCTQCSMTSYLYKQQCLADCPDGYFQQPNGVLGNSCIKCYAPCVKCTSGLVCLECDDTYRVDNNQCVACGFTTNCIKCDTDTCLECIIGYQPSGQECVSIESNCGDGLHALTEQCDDANLSGGCVDCKIQSGYNCILEQNEGPDVCYLLQPVTASPYIDEIHFDTLYLYFDRPLSQIYNLTELLYVNVPDLEDYQYQAIQTDLQHIAIKFIYYQTVQNIDAQLNFSVPNGIVDKFGWSLVGQANATSSTIAKFGIIKFTLNYYIFYNTDEIDFSNTLSYITLSFMLLCLLSSLVYSLKVGSGQVWQILQSMQLISLLRLIKLRYSLHIDKVLRVLDYCNMSFIPNIFTWFFMVPDQNTIKFQIENYPSQFLLNAGGRFISFMVYALIFWMVVKVLIRIISWEPILNRLEDIDEYMHFQAFIRIFEVMFLDVMVSTVQTGQVYFTTFDIINIVVAGIYLIITIVFAVLLYKFVLRDQEAHKLEWLHLHFSCIYDGYELKTKLGRLFIYVPYVRKVIYAFLFILPSQFIQVITLAVLRIIMYPFLFRFNPFAMRILLYRQTVQALFDTLCFVSGLLYLNIDDTKEVKVTNGWYMLMTILLSIINFTIWNAILIFVKIRSPNYLLEEYETEEEPQFKMNQIVPMDYLPPEEEQKNGKIVPEGYEKPPEVGIAQIMPEKQLKGGQPDKSLQILKDPDIVSVKSEVPQMEEKKVEQVEQRLESEAEIKQKEKEIRKQTTLIKKQQEALKKQEEEKDALVDDFFG